MRNLALLLALALGACGGTSDSTASDDATDGAETAGDETSEPGDETGDEAPPQPARVLADGSRLFGAELSEEREDTPLASIIADPSAFDGQVVKTSGEISAVCQAQGCWMELRPDTDSPGIRVPMANHAFFLPRDLAGARATIEGTVSVTALDEETRAHLESEGAQAAGSELSIEATGVLVRP
ncbi:MAG: DUF4920 domain-containing protein [Sandaracinaceae bacterium]